MDFLSLMMSKIPFIFYELLAPNPLTEMESDLFCSEMSRSDFRSSLVSNFFLSMELVAPEFKTS